MEGRRAVARYLRGKDGFALVSHDRSFLDECVDHILAIGREGVEVSRGNFSAWEEQKRRRDAFEEAQNLKLGREIDRLRDAAAQRAGWAAITEKEKFGSGGVDRGYIGHKAAKMMKRSKEIENRRTASIEEKSRLLKNIETSPRLELKPAAFHTKRLLSLEDVAISYGGREVLRGFGLTLEAGERVALRGGNGSGKSSVLRFICGDDVPHSGVADVARGLNISRVPQDASFLTGSPAAYAEERGLDRTLFFAMLNKLDFPKDRFDGDMAGYSEGQRKKVLIAASLCDRAHLYVWDEPLNYIDVFSRMQIEDMIRECGPTMVFAEHDRAFCDRVATRVVEL